MIASLTGRLISKSPGRAIVDIQGIGYELLIPLNTFFHLPDPPATVTLFAHLAVRNDTIHLYGFLSQREKEAFLVMLNISGIGPKSALAVLSTLTVTELASAVVDNDLARLSSIPGVGKKSAGRLALELKDKLERLSSDGDARRTTSAPQGDGILIDAQSALVNLGYKPSVAKNALQSLRNDHHSLYDLINAALKVLAK